MAEIDLGVDVNALNENQIDMEMGAIRSDKDFQKRCRFGDWRQQTCGHITGSPHKIISKALPGAGRPPGYSQFR